MPRSPQATGRTPFIVSLVLIGAVLYFAREVFVPIALAVFMAFILAPIVRILQRFRLSRVAAVVVTVGIATAAVGVFGWLVEQQAVEIASKLPEYKANVSRKLSSLRTSTHAVLGEANTAIKELGREMAKPDAEPAPTRDSPAPVVQTAPLVVRMAEDATPPLTYAATFLGPVLGRLATAGMVVVFTVFMLLRKEDLRNRIVRLIGEREMHITTTALDDAAQRLSSYLLTQSLINAGVGLFVGVGLFFLGVPSAPLWGLVIALLRFVPYVGTWLGAAFPFIISLAGSDGWTQPLMVLGLIGTVEMVGGNFVEPMLVGSGTGLSPLAVLTSAVLWAWLWGPVGLILSTPITVCLSVLGRHVRRLSFLSVLLGDEPVLTPEANCYQRLLAGDQEEATRIVDDFAEGKSAVDVFDGLLIPTLRLAEADRHRGDLDERQEQAIRDILAIIIDDLGIRPRQETPGLGSTIPVVCVPVRDAADELAGRMLEKVLLERGLSAETLSSRSSTRELVEQISKLPPSVLCISALPPSALLHTRVIWQQLRTRCPQHKIIVGLWDEKLDLEDARTRLGDIPNDSLTTSLRQAVECLEELAGAISHASTEEPAIRAAAPNMS